MEKSKYYISIATGEISKIPYQNNREFTIYATDDEIRLLRAKMDNLHDASMGTFWRSHIPIVPYHHDQSNDAYDRNITEAYRMIHELGDEEAKSHIEEMGVLDQRHM